MQAAAGVAPNAAPKPIKAQGDKVAVPSAKTGAPADPQAGVPLTDSVKDGQASSNGDKAAGDNAAGDKAAGEFHRAVSDLLTKPEASAPAQQGGDAGCGQGQRRRGAKS